MAKYKPGSCICLHSGHVPRVCLPPAPLSAGGPGVGSALPPLLSAPPPPGAQGHEEGAEVIQRRKINCTGITLGFQGWFTELRRGMEKKRRARLLMT